MKSYAQGNMAVKTRSWTSLSPCLAIHNPLEMGFGTNTTYLLKTWQVFNPSEKLWLAKV